VERNVVVRTPESVAFSFELAGIGSRFLAVTIDFIIQALAAIGVVLLVSWATPGIHGLGSILHLDAEATGALVAAIVIIALFLVFVGYFIAFETVWNGQTPGKRAIGIRVVRDGGYPIRFMDAAIRNLIRTIEAALAYVPSVISALISQQNKRLGDLAAGTIVVRDRRFDVADAAAWGRAAQGPALAFPGIERMTDEEVALAQRYVVRSHLLDRESARATAARIAAAIRPKLGPESVAYGDHELLVRVAASRSR
jgi:uncharacterized RDD family membrane protein YckC